MNKIISNPLNAINETISDMAKLGIIKNILGIDPGQTGALALLSPTGRLLEIHDMPMRIEKIVKGKTKMIVDSKALQNLLYAFVAEQGDMVAYLEDVHAMPSQGVVSMFNMGATFGAIKAVLSCEQIPIYLVTPQSWKKALNVPMGKELTINEKKEYARKYVYTMYPQFSQHFSRKKDHNRAEAVLIAKYGLKEYNKN